MDGSFILFPGLHLTRTQIFYILAKLNNFLSVLKSRTPLIADGAMGTMLYSLGVPKGHCYDELNLSKPEIIAELHSTYARHGAKLIETNTFGANRFILEKYYDLGKKTFDINYQGAKITGKVALIVSLPVRSVQSLAPSNLPKNHHRLK